MLISVAVFAVMDATMKYLGQSYPPLQVAALRGAASLPFIALLAAVGNRWGDLRPRRWPMHIVRGLLAVLMLGLFVFSLRSLSLASAYVIVLCAPLLIAALSVWLLGERVDWRSWIAIAVGLLGVSVMLRPQAGEMISWGALAALASAVCYAFAAILIRKLSQTETTVSVTFSFFAIIACVAGALAWPQWIDVQLAHWPWIFALGLSGAVGQYFIVEAFRHAPASVAAPFEYTALLWAGLLDWILWQTTPHGRTLLGGGIVAATGLYLIYSARDNALAQDANTP